MTTSSKGGRSLARSMVVVAIIAADLAALRASFPRIPNPGLVAMVLILEVGLFRTASRSGEARAFWVGFEVSGWLYVLACSVFARLVWGLTRSAFEGALLGRPVGTPSEMNRYLLFASLLQFAIALALASTVGLLARVGWRRFSPPRHGGSSCGC